jgi:signal transduction histidine kinase
VQTVEERRREKEASIHLEIAEEATARGDPAGVEQVLENLVDNALKYGPPGVAVRVTAERSGAGVRIVVADTGPGIAPEHLPRIFERFYRVDPARSRDQGGAGLGLAIAAHLVEGMNGTVTAESEVGRGSRFIVTLPATP